MTLELLFRESQFVLVHVVRYHSASTWWNKTLTLKELSTDRKRSYKSSTIHILSISFYAWMASNDAFHLEISAASQLHYRLRITPITYSTLWALSHSGERFSIPNKSL